MRCIVEDINGALGGVAIRRGEFKTHVPVRAKLWCREEVAGIVEDHTVWIDAIRSFKAVNYRSLQSLPDGVSLYTVPEGLPVQLLPVPPRVVAP